MALTGVLRPGHVQIRVLDLDEAVAFYTQILGLVETGRDASGRVYLKACDERDHHSVILRKADRAGTDFYGFKVLNARTLDLLETDLRAYGVQTERVRAGDLLETGERVRFHAPTGHLFELYAEKTEIGDTLGYLNPDVIIEDRKGISPVRLDHWQIHGEDLDGSRDLFVNVLGFSLTERILCEDGKTDMAVWLTCSNKAHDIAFVRDARSDTSHHAAFLIETWKKLLYAADLMAKRRVSIDIGPLRHGITRGTSIYFFDPSGNRIETFCGGYSFYPDMKPYTWTWEEMGAAIFYHTRELNERFLSVVT
ncbi:catechol 2,3-dioxygenase [Pararobbsia silviterrae]|uniref:Catechol 2,3-dioxygenase n=1 Tax=Pararobbsia silviterrae TaxID=1792498 RepID=A0A494XGB3_9BURK|nr:catechol 2,3-dioxygenase [Pararobbsia silviterrae]RKP47124.1 catechol 2,3-dioxygenase [Pararobbsia silviterrae]